jgi:hypothetical protein
MPQQKKNYNHLDMQIKGALRSALREIIRLFMKHILLYLALFTLSLVFSNALYAQDAADKLNMLEIVVSNLVTRIEALEKRLNALEKTMSTDTSKKILKKDSYHKDAPLPSSMGGHEDIGDGFFVKNVRFVPFGVNVLFTGEITNKSEKNFRFAKFSLEVYDDRDLLVKKEEFTIPDMPKNSAKTFETMLLEVDINSINRYIIKAVK